LVKRSPIARGVFFLAVLVSVFASGSRAATLDVVGPAGAEVVIDGMVVGTLPLPAPLVLPHGQMLMLEVRRNGYITHDQQVWLETTETELSIDVDLLTLSRKTAVVSSSLLAGTGQFYQGRQTAGWIQMGLQLTVWGSVIVGELAFQDKRDEYETLDQEYQDALAPSEITRLRDERDASWNEMQDAKTWRNVSIGAVLIVAAYSAVDAWRGHSRFYATVEPPSASVDGSTTMKAGLSWTFGGGVR
jgi:hypothetical protein